jgi:hypothetical protein
MKNKYTEKKPPIILQTFIKTIKKHKYYILLFVRMAERCYGLGKGYCFQTPIHGAYKFEVKQKIIPLKTSSSRFFLQK